MGRLFTTLIAFTVAGLLAACSGTNTATTPGRDNPTTTQPTTTTPAAVTTVSIATIPTIEGYDLETTVTNFVGSTPGGAVVLALRNHALTTAAVGTADADGTPLLRETPFRVGSISKTFVATMVLQMVEVGRVDLDEPLGTYLPDVPIGAEITIRQLLSHRSGLPNYTNSPAFVLALLGDFTKSYTPDEILGFVDPAAADAPGSFEYSNTNYILLGMLVEQLDGVSLNEALQERIAGPLGLSNTRFVGRGVVDPQGLAAFWSFGLNTGLRDADYESVASSAWAAGALVSTVDDLTAFLISLVEGDLLGASALAEMTDTGSAGYGLGLFAVQLGEDNPGFGHNGTIPGFSSTMGIAPVSGDILVVLTNNDFLVADQLAQEIVAEW